MLKKNINLTGRLIRASVGLLLLSYGLWRMNWIALAGALFTFFEAYMSWCIVYQFLGINSCPLKQKKGVGESKNSKR
jgi:hypothetical protein